MYGSQYRRDLTNSYDITEYPYDQINLQRSFETIWLNQFKKFAAFKLELIYNSAFSPKRFIDDVKKTNTYILQLVRVISLG